MTVQELIDLLNDVENKNILVCLEDWNELYRTPHEVNPIGSNEYRGEYVDLNHNRQQGAYFILTA